MAKAKTTPKKAKEAVVPKTVDEMKKALADKQQEMLETRRSHRAGELVNPRALTLGRREIARLKTAIRADELKGDK